MIFFAKLKRQFTYQQSGQAAEVLQQLCRIRLSQAVADRVWFEIQSFGGYSFAIGYSASFAVESYQSLYQKAHYHPIEDTFDEIEIIGFPLCDPFNLLATTERGNTLTHELMSKLKQQVIMVGYLITTKDTGTKNKELMHFGTFYDYKGIPFDTVHFPQVARKYPFRGRGFYLLKGKVVEDFGVPCVEVNYMEKLPLINKRSLPNEPLLNQLTKPHW